MKTTPAPITRKVKRIIDTVEIPLYFKDGKPTVILDFDPAKHVYYRRGPDVYRGKGETVLGVGERVPGVSTICQILGKPQLVPWAAKMVAEKLLSTVPVLTDGKKKYLDTLWYTEFEELVRAAQKAPREIKETAGDIGTQAHKIIEKDILTSIKEAKGIVDTKDRFAGTDYLDDRVVNCVYAAFKWMDSHKVKWISTETVIYHIELNYAGTLDGIALVSSCDDKTCCPVKFSNVKSLIDWKSSNSLHTEYCYQSVAYLEAYNIEHYTSPAIEHRWILQLGKETGEFHPWYLDPSCYNDDLAGFKACLDLTRIHKKVEDRMKKAH